MGNCIEPNKVKQAVIKPAPRKPYRQSRFSKNSSVPTYPSIEDVLRSERMKSYNTHITS